MCVLKICMYCWLLDIVLKVRNENNFYTILLIIVNLIFALQICFARFSIISSETTL